MTRVAVITTASSARLAHLHRQRRFLREAQSVDAELLRIEAWLDEEAPHETGSTTLLHVPPGAHGLRVGAARNVAARHAVEAAADLLVFLDVDCLPGPDLLPLYTDAARRRPDDILAGPVTYLASVQRPNALADLPSFTRPHPARPDPSPGTPMPAAADDYALFWSLSFAVTPRVWEVIGGFDEAYEGYGAEDTDFAFRARDRGVGLTWVGGAHAYHQWHPSGTPPWRHLDDILRNGRIFADRWGTWPMDGWLAAFASAGAIERDGDGWRRVV
ncbi:galactosyltransferase-related protein [Microbacterium chocolatum]|uniref:galactosyltransferase-related protein n=1 Tax=Microbacterium aurantiacum TaxID=162393 RepID=UPI003390344D